MANQKKRRHARYDRLAGVGMFVLCVVLLVILITRCTKKQPEEPVSSTAVNVTISSETVSVQERKNYAQASVPTEKVHSGHMILVNQAFPCQIDSEAVLNGSSSEIQFVTIKSILDTKTEEVKPYTAADWEVGLDKVAALAMDKWLETFTKRDPEKLQTAKANNLNYIMIYPSSSLKDNYKINNNKFKDIIKLAYNSQK